jgi:2-oxoglutarate dehydrogenase E1 component
MLNLAKSAYKNSIKCSFLTKNFHSSKSLQSPDTFMNGTNSIYLEQMYDNWVKDRKSVHPSWDAYFTNVTKGLTGEQAFQMPPEAGTSTQTISRTYTPSTSQAMGTDLQRQITASFKIYLLVLSYAKRGHEIAQLDPLSIKFHPT